MQRKTISLFVALFLVLTQALGIHHAFDSDAHEHGDSCELCAHLATLDHGIVAKLSFIAPVCETVVFGPPARHLVFLLIHPTHYARAPPVGVTQA